MLKVNYLKSFKTDQFFPRSDDDMKLICRKQRRINPV